MFRAPRGRSAGGRSGRRRGGRGGEVATRAGEGALGRGFAPGVKQTFRHINQIRASDPFLPLPLPPPHWGKPFSFLSAPVRPPARSRDLALERRPLPAPATAASDPNLWNTLLTGAPGRGLHVRWKARARRRVRARGGRETKEGGLRTGF